MQTPQYHSWMFRITRLLMFLFVAHQISLNFSLLCPGNVEQIFPWALTYCFISPSLICNCGKMFFLCQQVVVNNIVFNYCDTVSSGASLSSHKHKKHGYFVYPPCYPSKKLTILRSTHYPLVIITT